MEWVEWVRLGGRVLYRVYYMPDNNLIEVYRLEGPAAGAAELEEWLRDAAEEG